MSVKLTLITIALYIEIRYVHNDELIQFVFYAILSIA
jgi:hypothetical protein